jgi:2-polyprenyl-3-methyl-5-hydroxy-6-metoxy-1,4-benzoquinol methylase
LVEANYDREQERVDEYFDSQSAFWRDTYQDRNALGFINRQRQTAALKYVDELSLSKISKVLEIGCGAGFLAVALARRGFAVEATDHAPAMIELTRRHAIKTGMDGRIHARIENVHQLSYEDKSFDLVVSLGVINWLYDLRKALGEINRVLKPKGYAVLNSARAHALLNPLAIPALESILERIKHGFQGADQNKSRCIAPSHMYLPAEINRYLREANLTVIKSTNVGFGPFRILGRDMFPHVVENKIQEKLQRFADRGFPILKSAGGQYIALAGKNNSTNAT